MLRGRRPPSQAWNTFLSDQAGGISAVDFLVVPTLTFERLFAFIVLGIWQRCILWISLTSNPTAEWLARQIIEAFPWDTALPIQKLGVRDVFDGSHLQSH
jgi:hypothetical protein